MSASVLDIVVLMKKPLLELLIRRTMRVPILVI